MKPAQALNISRKIILSTLNSSYAHAAFGLRYLLANMQDLQNETEILEFTISAAPRHIVEKILAKSPQIVGFGVYIWNAEETLRVISILKKVSPQTLIVLGGPEISFETKNQRLYEIADFVIQGEADFLFHDFCKQVLSGHLPESKIISGPLPSVPEIKLPYDFYNDDDIKNRIIYVEASRGCPFKCEYCLSSLDKSVRNFPLDIFLKNMESLLERGVRQFKFVDRTFNLSPTTSTQILKFFLDRIHMGLFIHFEMIPDRLPEEIKSLIQLFPAGSLQFEIGIQTFDPAVQKNVSRRNDFEKVRDNFEFLKSKTGVHTHADLIVGLPGENLKTFGEGFNKLLEYQPDEIQVGILKRLKGTPIIRHESSFRMVYSEQQPFEILSTSTMSFSDIQDMQRFAKLWDLVGNSGNYFHFLKALKEKVRTSFFDLFFDFSQVTGHKVSHLHSLSHEKVSELCFEYLTQNLEYEATAAAKILILDYCFLNKRRDLPRFLKNSKSLYEELRGSMIDKKEFTPVDTNHLPQRQALHQKSKETVNSLIN